MQEVMEPILQIQVLGKFTLRYGETVISDEDDRSRKVWAVLAYLIYHREKIISQQELVDLCWGEDTRSSDPHNALKSVIHRIRATLDKLQEGLGRTLLRRKAGCYIWNTDVPLEVDAEVFDTLCSRGAALEGDERLDAYQQALALYSNDILPKLSSELWLVPITTYYHQRYVQTAEESIQLLEEQDRLKEAILLARQAVRIEPYQERLYAQLIRTLLKMGNQKGAIAVYEEMSELFFSNFGVMPSDELRALYRKATRTVNNHALSVEDLRDQLKEEHVVGGAMLCTYDFFKILYRSETRTMARTGNTAHLCLLSVAAKDGSELPKRSLDRAMENLQELIRQNLRKGDVASQCSVSQYVILLPRANYENSHMVANRLMTAFYRRYPHSPARLRCVVQPLEPLA